MVDSAFLAGMERVRRSGEQRWRNPDGSRYYTWDSVHQEVEAFDKRGNHRGVLDPGTGKLIKAAVKGRTIDV